MGVVMYINKISDNDCIKERKDENVLFYGSYIT